MGCSSYLTGPDPANPSASISLQFKYGFLREISYELGDEVQWERAELPKEVDTNGDAVVPAWTQGLERYFALQIIGNRLIGFTEISEAEGDQMYDQEFEHTSRHAWKKI